VGGVGPQPFEVDPQRVDSFRAEAIDAPGSVGDVVHERGTLQETEMTRDGRTADRQAIGDRLN
jgi:hypothetical protein